MKLFEKIDDFLNSPVPSKEEILKKMPVFRTREKYKLDITNTIEMVKQDENFKQYMMAYEFADVLFNVSHMSMILSDIRDSYDLSFEKMPDFYAHDFVICYEFINKSMKMIEECNDLAAKDIRNKLDRIFSYMLNSEEKTTLNDLYCKFKNRLEDECHEKENK